MSEHRALSSYRGSLSANAVLGSPSCRAGGVWARQLDMQQQPVLAAAVAPPLQECRVEWSMACDLKVKYEQIDDLDELNRLLRENNDFDERRALRAVIRAVKERQGTIVAGGSQNGRASGDGGIISGSIGSPGAVPRRVDGAAQTATTAPLMTSCRQLAGVPHQVAEGSIPHLGADEDEERLRRRLREVLDYDEKKQIRAAIRDIRKRKGASLDHQQPESPREPVSSGLRSSSSKVNYSNVSSGNSSAPVAVTVGVSNSHGMMLVSPRKHVRPVSWAGPQPALASSGTRVPASVAAAADRAAALTPDARYDKTVEGAAMNNAVQVPSVAVSQCDNKPNSRQQQQELSTAGLSTSEVVIASASSLVERSSPENCTPTQQPSLTEGKTAHGEHYIATTAAPAEANGTQAEPLVLRMTTDQVEVKIPVQHAPAGSVPTMAVVSVSDASPRAHAAERKLPGGPASQPVVDSAVATPKIKSSLIRLQSDKINAGKLQAGALANFNRLSNGTGIGRVSSLRIVSTRKPPKIVLPLSDTKAIDGSSQLSFTVGLCDTGSSPSVQWYKNGHLLRPCKEMQQQYDQQTARLVFEEVFPDDAGVYRCVVQNEFGQAETSARLTIESNPLWKTPEFVLGLVDTAVKSGSTLVFRVQVLAVPNPVLLWYRDNELLDDNQFVRQAFDGTTGTLTISSVDAGSTGMYRCLARNSVGEQQTACRLTVTGPDNESKFAQDLYISRGLESIEPHDGDVGVSLSCYLSTRAAAATTVTWSKDGKILISSDDMKQSFDGIKASLMFNEIFPDDAGTYTCEIKVGKLLLATSSSLKVVGQKIQAPTEAQERAVSSLVADMPPTDSTIHGDDSAAAPAETSVGSSLINLTSFLHDGLPPDSASTSSSSNLPSQPTKADTNNNNEFSSIVDEAELQKVLDNAHDYETRKKIRARLRELRETKRAERDLDRRRIDEEKAAEAKRKLAEAEQDKKKILDKFAELAKASSIGAKPNAVDELARRNVAAADDEKRQALQQFQERAKDSIGARTSVQQDTLKFKVDSADQAKEASLRSYQNVARVEAEQRKAGSSGHNSHDQQPLAAATASAASLGQPMTKEIAQSSVAAIGIVQMAAAKPAGSGSSILVQAAEPAVSSSPGPQQQHSVLTRAAPAQQQPRPVSMMLKLELQPTRGAAAVVAAPLSAPITSPNPAAMWTAAPAASAAAATDPVLAVRQNPAETSAPVSAAAAATQTPTRPVISGITAARLDLQPQQSPTTAAPFTPARPGGVTPVQAPGALLHSCHSVSLSQNEETNQAPSPKKEVAESRSPDQHDGASKAPQRVAFSTPSPVTSPAGSAKTPPAGAKGAMAAFKQLDKTNNPTAQQTRPNYLSSPSTPSATSATPRSGGGLQRSVSDIKEMLLNWCRHATKDYKISIDNYSTSWNNGMAFCALIHHFYPEAFDYNSLDPKNRRYNFTLAFDTAEKYADISPLLDVEDMVRMEKPDWKCVFTYVQSFYRKLRNNEVNKHPYAEN